MSSDNRLALGGRPDDSGEPTSDVSGLPLRPRPSRWRRLVETTMKAAVTMEIVTVMATIASAARHRWSRRESGDREGGDGRESESGFDTRRMAAKAVWQGDG